MAIESGNSKICYLHAKSLILQQVFLENLNIVIINDIVKQPNFKNLVVLEPIKSAPCGNISYFHIQQSL